MRTIKFRGKRLSDGEWVYGDLCNYRGNVYIKEDEYCWDIQLADEVDPETIGQFTSMSDFEGQPIYEGDILRSFPRSGIVVEWEDLWAGFSLDEGTIANGYKIVGNIHDNPELAKSK